MKQYLVMIGLISLAILIAGCTSTGSQSTVNTTSPLQSSPTVAPSSATPTALANASYHFSGHGIQSTDRFYLNSGLTTFNTTNTHENLNETRFQAYLYDSNGTLIDTIADSDVEMNVKHNTVIRAPGNYYINVNTKNGWNITVIE